MLQQINNRLMVKPLNDGTDLCEQRQLKKRLELCLKLIFLGFSLTG